MLYVRAYNDTMTHCIHYVMKVSRKETKCAVDIRLFNIFQYKINELYSSQDLIIKSNGEKLHKRYFQKKA